MKQKLTVKDIVIGGIYMMRRGMKRQKVLILSEETSPFNKGRRYWKAKNLATQREVIIKSAAKFILRVS